MTYSMKWLQAKGKIFSGEGKGANFIKLPWVKDQIAEKIGFTPYPGTLNIKLTKDSVHVKTLLKSAKAIELSPPQGFCRGKCFKARFMKEINCAVIIPEIEDYPENIIEVIAATNLRSKFQLRDGKIVYVEIMI